jgi:WD40 repeat protein
MASLSVRLYPNSENLIPAEVSEFPYPVWLNNELERVPVTAKQLLADSSSEQPCKVLRVDKKSGLAVLNVGRNSTAGTTHFLPVRWRDTDGTLKSNSLGRTECVGADSDSSNKIWVTLHRHGEIWFSRVPSDSEVTWKRWPSEILLDQGLETPEWVQVSPSGNQLLVGGKSQSDSIVLLCDVAKLQVVKAWSGSELAAWHPEGNRMAMVKSDGAISLVDIDNLTEEVIAGNLPALRGDKTITSIDWFKESLSNGQTIEDRWFLVLGLGDQELAFVPGQGHQDESEDLNFEVLKMESPITAIACSPRDATLVVGTRDGNMTTWFASPTVDVRPRELFSIDRHRGSAITELRFTADGRALYSADSGSTQQANVSGATEKTGRAFGWLATGVR